MKILITGGAGFIGSNLAAFYLNNGHEVEVYDNLSRPGVQHNLEWLQSQNKQLTVTVADMLDETKLAESVRGKDVIFHEAGQTAVTTSLKDPATDFKTNVVGSFNLLEATRQFAPEAILMYASTNKVYGNLSGFEFIEGADCYEAKGINSVPESWPLDFYSPYGCSKGTADQYFHDYARSFGLKTVVFRQSCIYGEHQFGVEDQGWVAHFAAQIIKNQPITIFGNGKQVRDLLHIDDLIRAYDSALQKIEVTKGQVYNIGGGLSNSASLKEVLADLEKASGKTIDPQYTGTRLGDQMYYVSDFSKATKDFGWSPSVALPDGLKRLYAWLSEFLTK